LRYYRTTGLKVANGTSSANYRSNSANYQSRSHPHGHPGVRAGWGISTVVGHMVQVCMILHTSGSSSRFLGWTRPKLRDPAAVGRWTWLILACYAQLYLARPLAADIRLPRQQPASPATRHDAGKTIKRTGTKAKNQQADRSDNKLTARGKPEAGRWEKALLQKTEMLADFVTGYCG
jgi:hypothetical protein